MSSAAKCILCAALLGPNTKPEHIWLSSLGGRKASRSLLCDACNNKFGSGPDKALAESVAFLRNLMKFPDGKRGEPPTLRDANSRMTRSHLNRAAYQSWTAGSLSSFRPSQTEIPRWNCASPMPHICKGYFLISQRCCARMNPRYGICSKLQTFAMFRSALARRLIVCHWRPDAMRSMMKTCLLLWAEQYGSQELERECLCGFKAVCHHGADDLVGRITHLVTRRLRTLRKLSLASASTSIWCALLVTNKAR